MSKTVDKELTKAFSELQQMMLQTTQKLKLADLQIDTYKKSKQRSELTAKEIKTLTQDTKTYESVGRMFLLTPLPTVLDHLDTRAKTNATKIKSLEASKMYLEKTLEEHKNNLREMVQLRK